MCSKEKLEKSPGIEGYLVLFTVLAAIGLYSPVLVKMAAVWKVDGNYSHGFFIPLISAYMVYTIRDEIKSIRLQPVNLGGILILLGLAQLYIASVGSEYFLQRTSFIVVLLGVVLFLAGRKVTIMLLLPITYLIFMVPLPAIIWNKIAFPMQLFSSAVTEEVIRMIGIPIYREGNILHLAQTTLEVVDACSGLRSLNTMFALSIALAWFSISSSWKKWALFFSAAPVAIFANIVRLTITAVLASIYGEQAAQGFLHEFSGMFTFLFGLSLLLLISRILQRKKIALAD